MENLESRRLLAAVGVAALDAAAAEASLDVGKFRLTRDVTTGTLTVNFALSGTAEAGTDFDTVTESVTFAAGAATADVTIKPKEDTEFEGSETVILTISEDDAYTINSSADDATINLSDNDKPAVSITVFEPRGNEGPDTDGVPAWFTLTRTGTTANPLAVKFTISGTAINGTDYDTLATTATFDADEDTIEVRVVPKDDATLEGTETVIATLATDAAYTFTAGAKGTITILDDEKPTVTVTAADATAVEGSATDTAKFTVSRNGPTQDALPFQFTLGGVAVSGTDYDSFSTTSTIPAGKASVDVIIKTKQDTDVEGSETVKLTVSSMSGYLLENATKSATVTITDDEKPTISLTASDANAVESGSNTSASFTLARNGATGSAITIPVVVTGTATKASDYKTLATNVTIPAGKSSVIVKVKAKDDNLLEGPETVILTLGTGTTFLADAAAKTATVTIADDEKPDVGIAATDATATEPTTDKGVFTITRNGPTTEALTVNYTILTPNEVGIATEGTDYDDIENSVVIPAGKASATVTITPKDDTSYEGFERVIIKLSDSAAYDIDPYATDATVKIIDNEKPTLSFFFIKDDTDETPSDVAAFAIERNGGIQEELLVSYTITGTGKNGVDYQKVENTILLPVGSIRRNIEVRAIADTEVEGDETAIFTLKAASTYTLPSEAVKTITINDDETATVTITGTDLKAGEPTDKGTVTFTRNGPTTNPMTVNYSTGGSATKATDYAELSGAVIIPAGKNSVTVDVTPVEDTTLEGNETVIVKLEDATTSPYIFDEEQESVTVTISDNEKPAISVVATDSAVSESDSENTGVLTFARTGPTTEPLTIQYTVTGTAKSGTDVSGPLSGSLTFNAGQASKTIELVGQTDDEYEGDETIVATIKATPASYTIDDEKKAATVTIADDDLPVVSIVATKATAKENGGTKDPLTFTVSRTGITTAALEVTLTHGGTSADADFAAEFPSTATIPAGKSSVLVTLVPKDDTTYESIETATVGIDFSGEKPYTVGSTLRTATAKLADNELPTISLVAGDSTASEEGATSGYFTVSRDIEGEEDLVVNVALTGNAKNGKDYTAISKTVTIPAGESSVRVYVSPKNDTRIEGDETVSLALATGTGYLVHATNKSGTVTIADDDAPTVSISAASSTVDENDAEGTWFRISRDGQTTNYALTVNLDNLSTADDALYVLKDEDGNTITDSITLAVGEAYVDVYVLPVDDSTAGDDSLVKLTLLTDDLYDVDEAATDASITIVDDD